MTTAVLSLGGNVGDPRQTMARALRLLDDGGDTVLRVSRLYRTPPWGPVVQPAFLNCCALVDTQRAPDDLLNRCLGVERMLLRERRERWGPRTIDIDLIDMDGIVRARGDLVLPHPRAHERAFVLVPWAEMLPDRLLAGRPARDWLGGTDTSDIVAESLDGDWWRTDAAQSSAV